MEKTLAVLNDLERTGILPRYAIGGAMAATFYVEPVLTFDLDIFTLLPSSGGIITLAPLYESLSQRGYQAEGETVDIEGVPVQFLPAFNPLLEEAMAEARETLYGDVPTRVLRAEHLIAIAVQTGRPKDQQRVRMLHQEAKLDTEYLTAILARHSLTLQWRQWTS